VACERDGHTRGASVARRGGGGVAVPRLQRGSYRTSQR
jgi:hypothetical protein